jgi:succinate-semialdehyde dehydrogenase/glutarate-semialdehyde dehydrogenase
MFKSINPTSGEHIASYPVLTEQQLEAKIAKSVAAFAVWRKTGLPERTALLGKLATCYDANSGRLARMAAMEMGKTLTAATAEVLKCAAAFRYYATHGPDMLEPVQTELSTGGRAEVRWLPLGPVLAIMPWNFPYWQAVRFLAPAIMAGNTGLLKHASIVQGCAALMEEMVLQAGGPEGLFQNLAIKSGTVGQVIADSRDVALTLTGTEGDGIAVAQQAGRSLKKIVLELGGSDPFIVMPSANVDKAVKKAVQARIQNTGQSCICG